MEKQESLNESRQKSLRDADQLSVSPDVLCCDTGGAMSKNTYLILVCFAGVSVIAAKQRLQFQLHT